MRPFHPHFGGARLLDAPGLNRCIEIYARSKLRENDVEISPSTSMQENLPISSELDSAVPLVNISSQSGDQVDEREALRRKRISMANTGKVPWNLGRKHPPETIEKIREKSMEAMKRPEVAENFRRGVEQRVQVHSPEIRAKISEKLKEQRAKKRVMLGLPSLEQINQEKEEKKLERERERARRKAEREEAKRLMAENIKAQKAAANQMRDQMEPKKRTSNSAEHRKAISEAIKAKWRDPEYRELAVRRMKEVKMEQVAAQGTKVTGSKQSEGQSGSSPAPKKGTGSSSSNSKSSLIHQIQGIVNQLLASKQLLSNMDVKILEMKGQADAFLNDPIMTSRLDDLLSEVQLRRSELLVSVESLEAKIPPGFTFDETGRVFSSPHLKVDDRGSQEPSSRARSAKRSTVNTEASSGSGTTRTRAAKKDKEELKAVVHEPGGQLKTRRGSAKKTPAWDLGSH